MLLSISERARSAVSRTMKVGCFLKIYPYRWDTKKYRLFPASSLHMFIFRVHELFILWTFSYMSFRFVQTVKDDIPTRIRIMNFIWVLAYGLVLVVNAEFEFKRHELMLFINSLCEVMDCTRNQTLQLKKKFNNDDLPESRRKGKRDFTSLTLLVSSFLLFANPPAHATVLFSSPCAPQYITSLIFPCKSALDIPVSLFEIIPFVILENIFITDMMFNATFAWTFVFLGMTWIKEKMKISGGAPTGRRSFQINTHKFDNAPENYREAQLITLLLNDAFKYYLQWYPNLLFTILGMLIFGVIRYPHIDLHSYTVFPACSLRCAFDVISVLTVAGGLNKHSQKYLAKWYKQIDQLARAGRKYLRSFHKSCWRLTCTAGGMYTFENSIVLVSLDNCTQLVFNMLITYD